MRAATALSLGGLLLCSCAGDARHARVELDLRTEPCASDDPIDCTVHLVGSGLIFTAGSETDNAVAGTDTLYAEIETASGALALIEIGLEERGIRHIRYREVKDGAVSLKARVEQPRLKVPKEGPWQFSFDAVDDDAPEGAEPVRVITNGQVLPHEGDVRTEVEDPSGGGGGGGSSGGTSEPHVVIILDGYTPPRRAPEPTSPSEPYGDDDPRGPVYDPPVIDSGGGCDGDTDYDSGGGCDGDSGGGCEGDTSDYDAGGCDGGGGGCEGDTAGSAPDCDSCEGDVAMRADLPPEVQRRRALLSMLRLSWPMWLAGWFNRKNRGRRPNLDDV